MGKRGRQPHPSLSSAASVRALLKRHGWFVPSAAAELGYTPSAVYLALKTYGVRIPEKEAKRIREASAKFAAGKRWAKG